MIGRLKAALKRRWPALRLRTIILSALVFVAALPGLSAIFLRVYENTLVRQTEAELIAQGAALAAVASADWPGARAGPTAPPDRTVPGYYQPEALTIDLSATSELPARPPAVRSAGAADPAARSAATTLEPVLEQTSRTTLASIVLLDGKGVVVRGAELGGSYAALPEVRSALGGRAATVLRRNDLYHPRYSFEWLSRASAVRIHHARPVVVNGRVEGVLLLSRSPRALFKGVYQDRGKILLGVGGILALLVVLSGLLSRGVTRPIVGLSAATREVAAGGGRIPETPRTAAVEIQALYEDFRAMSEAIARRSRYLRDFAAAVSHEFKTPLAGISGAAELLQDHYSEMSDAERSRFLANISADAARLNQLVTRLLDLARADMVQPSASATGDPANAIARVSDAMGGSGFSVAARPSTNLPTVGVPEATLEAVLTALVENSRQAGAKEVRIIGHVADRHVILTVSDDGPGVPQADQARLFEPFFTSRRASGGTGLGLPIARSLLAASHARIDIIPSNHGAAFELALPVAADR